MSTTLRYKIWKTFLKGLSYVKVSTWPLFFNVNPHTFDIKGNNYYEIKNIIKPGDILLRAYRYYLDGMLIPGKYSHAALYEGGKLTNKSENIIHAIGEGVCETDLCTFLRCDKIAVIRPNYPENGVDIVLNRMINIIGKPYDFDFVFESDGTTTTNRNFSCSEAIYYATEPFHSLLGYSLQEKNYILFKKVLFAPDNLIPTNSNSEIIYEK